jgi:hypothetical protein
MFSIQTTTTTKPFTQNMFSMWSTNILNSNSRSNAVYTTASKLFLRLVDRW